MENSGRAYAVFETKALDEKRRIFTGWATTPAPDRVQDTIDPMGATFKNPLVLLHQHRHDAPIGSVKFDKPTAKGIQFTAEIPVIDEPGPLKDRWTRLGVKSKPGSCARSRLVSVRSSMHIAKMAASTSKRLKFTSCQP